MNEDDLKRARRSTRLSISIPVVLSGVDADGKSFTENVRTVIINKHGGKIATTRRLAMGTEVLIENRAMAVVAKASVAWLSEKVYPGDLHHVGLQLLEAQNVWGIAFPPDDWQSGQGDEVSVGPHDLSAPGHAGTQDAGMAASSPTGEEVTVRLLHGLQQTSDAYAREFQDRLKQLTHRLGLELEFDLRERASYAKAREVGALEEEIKALGENLRAASEEIGKLQARIQELQGALPSTTESPSSPPTPINEARRQLAALANSVVESMNRAAAAGLSEYRNLLVKENQESAARIRPAAEVDPPPPAKPSPES
jgi:methyl-accepting chemotaxis protein